MPIESATEKQSYYRFLFFFTRQTTSFFKNFQNQHAKLIFPKNDKNLQFIGELFLQVLLTWNENFCERSKKIEVEDNIQKTDGEDEETVLEFLAQYKVYGYLKKW